uniref:Ig-like domain-containing protein n=1 Tax=Megaselia scalaris TaxID=36166 RepID=T1GVA1_MEGSC
MDVICTCALVFRETIELPCKVQNLGSFVLLWRKGTSVLTAGHLKISRDPRFKIVGDYNLQINGVKTQDAGDYICQLGDQENRDQVHTVEILVSYFTLFLMKLRQISANNTFPYFLLSGRLSPLVRSLIEPDSLFTVKEKSFLVSLSKTKRIVSSFDVGVQHSEP